MKLNVTLCVLGYWIGVAWTWQPPYTHCFWEHSC